jgi:hypothetical protein
VDSLKVLDPRRPIREADITVWSARVKSDGVFTTAGDMVGVDS